MTPSLQRTLPASLYRDPVHYETERRKIFARSWLLVAHVSQLSHPGNYLAVTAAGFPLIVVHGDDGTIRAFHNVCRHRAGPFANDGMGKCDGQLVCHYHGWRYTLDGKLAGVRDFGTASDFDRGDYPLLSIACEIWRGFVFVNMDQAPESFQSFIAPLDERAKHLPLEDFRFAKATSHELACNWKTYAENFLEAYHIPQIHPFLNSTIEAANFELKICPPAVFWEAPRKGDSPVSGLWAWVWPCLCVNVYNDGILMERIWPLSVKTTRLDYMYLFPGGVGSEVMDRTFAASLTTTLEDKAICEAVQRNLDAGVFDKGCLSPKHEQAVAWFDSELLRTVTRGDIV